MTEMIILPAIAFSLVGMGYHWLRLLSRPLPTLYAPPRGSARQGVLYAWGRGLLPGAKESTRRHPWVFWRGITLHIGIGAAFLILASSLLSGDVMSSGWMQVLALAAAIGMTAVLAAFVDRLANSNLRALSNYGDYLALMLVGAFLGLAAAEGANLVGREWFYLAAALMLFYLPLGKLTHFIYWCYGRCYFGRKYGYRGVIPEVRSGGGADG